MRGCLDPVANFREKYVVDAATGCWLWQATTMPNGYGKFGYKGRIDTAHRAAWQLFRGPIPQGLWVLHRCDVRSCVNPDHLFLGDRRENTADMMRKHRQARGERVTGARLTAHDVLRIRRSPASTATLAASLGVHTITVGNVRNGSSWKHVRE